jgi:hypothetical protein
MRSSTTFVSACFSRIRTWVSLVVSANESVGAPVGGMDTSLGVFMGSPGENLSVLMGVTDEGLRGTRGTLRYFPYRSAAAAYRIRKLRAQDRGHYAASPSQYTELFPPGHRPLLLCGCSALSSIWLQFPALYERQTLSTIAITKGLGTSAAHNPIFAYSSVACPVRSQHHPPEILANSPSRTPRNCTD